MLQHGDVTTNKSTLHDVIIYIYWTNIKECSCLTWFSPEMNWPYTCFCKFNYNYTITINSITSTTLESILTSLVLTIVHFKISNNLYVGLALNKINNRSAFRNLRKQVDQILWKHSFIAFSSSCALHWLSNPLKYKLCSQFHFLATLVEIFLWKRKKQNTSQRKTPHSALLQLNIQVKPIQEIKNQQRDVQ